MRTPMYKRMASLVLPHQHDRRDRTFGPLPGGQLHRPEYRHRLYHERLMPDDSRRYTGIQLVSRGLEGWMHHRPHTSRCDPLLPFWI